MLETLTARGLLHDGADADRVPQDRHTAIEHETVMAEGSGSTMAGMGSGTGSTMAMGDGAMTMKEVEEIELPKGEAVELKPGGYHIMLMELVKPLEKGTEIEITLTFEKAGELKVSVPVLDAAP